MLQNCDPMPTLGAATNLITVKSYIYGMPPLEAQERLRASRLLRVPAKLGRDAAIVEGSNQGLVENIKPRRDMTGPAVGHGGDKAVRQFLVMQNRPSAGSPADAEAVLAGRMLRPFLVLLEVAQGKGRFAPLVEPQSRHTQIARAAEDRLVDRHIPATGSGRVDDQTHLVHGGDVTR